MRGTEHERGGTPPFLFLVRLLLNAGINRLADAPIGSSGLARNPPRFHDHYATSAGAGCFVSFSFFDRPRGFWAGPAAVFGDDPLPSFFCPENRSAISFAKALRAAGKPDFATTLSCWPCGDASSDNTFS